MKIIADDFGLHKKVNEGIVLGLKNGWINGASIMVVGEAYEDAIQRLKSIENPNIGVHLVLVEENPLSNINLIKSLVTKEGRLFKGHKTFLIRYILGLIKEKDIELELRTQINKLIKSGVKPSFLNSHQHLHLLPKIMDIVIKLAKEYDISYIRIVREPIEGLNLVRIIGLVLLRFLSGKAEAKIRKNNLNTNDFFVGFLHAGNLKQNDIEKAKKLGSKYPNKVIELGTHPGYESEELKMKYGTWGSYSWQKELNILKNFN